MGYIGKFPTPQPLSATDIPDLPATKITSGTFPALNASNLTNLDAADLSGTLPALNGSALTNVSAGKVLNHYSNVQTSAITINATTSTVITSPNITPVSTSSKFVITPTFAWSSTNPNGAIFMYRELSGYNDLSPTQSISGNFGSTGNVLDLDENPGGSGNTHGFITYSCTFIDSPNTTSQLNYTLRVTAGTGQTIYVNRVSASSSYKGVSTMSILELSS